MDYVINYIDDTPVYPDADVNMKAINQALFGLWYGAG